MTKPIALTGKMRSGKDTVADYLVSKYGYTRFAFGDELKRYAHELFGNTEKKPRELYQWFGQAMRERDNDIWVRKCFDIIGNKSRINNTFRSSTLMSEEPLLLPVITDLRQPNEYDSCRDEGYVIIKVVADDTTRIERMINAGDDFTIYDIAHGTERYIDEFEEDYYINNNADITLDKLHAQIDELMVEITRQPSPPA